MAQLSKPLYNALAAYLSSLYTNPIRTKALTSCVLTAGGNLASQLISGSKTLNHQSIVAYGLYGLLFGGTVPHFYYKILESLVPKDASLVMLKKILFDRFIFMPLYQAFSLYTLARFEKKTHEAALLELMTMYWPILSKSLKYLTIVQVINLTLVPPMLRVLTMNLVGFFWVVYVATWRRQQQEKSTNP